MVTPSFYDNDGDPDLFVPVGHASWDQRGRDLLSRNNHGVFTDVAVEVGLADTLPTNSAIWLDYDRDGHLDLFRGSALGGVGDIAAYEAA
jgi:enediyne biosynthesis protein E4